MNTKHKGDIDLVTDADLECERYLISAIKEKFPDHSILSEEKGSSYQNSPYCWIIDPIDGTTNYSRGLPFYGISFALAYYDEVIFGIVHAPELHMFFHAEKGKGSYLNMQPINVSSNTQINSSFLVTGFPYTMRCSDRDNIDLFRRFSKISLAVRRLGSASLDFCFVAKGTFDAYWEQYLKPWDFAAGMLIVTEAKGQVSTMKNEILSPLKPNSILASNSLLHKQLLVVISQEK